MVVTPVASLDRLRERHLIAGAERDLLQRRDAAGGGIDPVDAALLQLVGELDGLRQIPAALDPVGRTTPACRPACRAGTPRAPRRRLRAESACGFPASRHIRRCACWRSATGTDAADSRARRAARSRRCRAARRAWRRRRRPRGCASGPPHRAPAAASRLPCAAPPTAPPSASRLRRRGISWPPSHGVWLEALRPAWASCIATAVFECLRTEARIGFSAASLASL